MTAAVDTNAVLRVSSFFALVLAFQVAIARFAIEKDAKRRFQHAITGHALVQISYLLPLNISIAAMGVGCAAIFYVRFYHDAAYKKVFGPLLRASELPDGVLPGAFYFLLGTMATASLFPLDIARYAVECLAFADPFASLVGKAVPSPKMHESASVAGCLACFGMALLLGLYFFDIPFKAALAGSLACTVAEAIPWINDNFSIPLATALAVVWTVGNIK